MINPTQTEVAEKPFATIAGANAAFNEIADEIEVNQSSDAEPDSAAQTPMQHGEVQPVVAAAIAQAEENLYECRHLRGGSKHPGKIVETPGLANIQPPRPTHRPYLPKNLIESGEISEIQLERIIYAGQAHAQILPCDAAARAGISIGDGTGVGKTATLLGIILDNWFSGRKRTVWFSVKSDLIKAIKDEMQRLKIHIPIQLVGDYKPEEEITLSKGVIFCTYQSLIAKSRKGHRRIDQLTKWLDREGILIFDEGHKAKNFFAENERVSTQTGAAVVEIQDV